MLLSEERLQEAYNHIKEQSLDAQSTTAAVYICCALDCDALCACQILVTLLQQDSIPHHIEPVIGYDTLDKLNKTVFPHAFNLRTVILLNCGGNVDVFEIFQNEAIPNTVNFFVFDSHRPFHLANVWAEERVFLFHYDPDGDAERAIPDQKEIEDLINSAEEEDASEQEDSEQYGMGRDGPKPQRRKTKAAYEKLAAETDLRERKQKKQMELDLYYSQSYTASSSAALLYELSNQLNRSSNPLLWLAIVGLSHQFLCNQIDAPTYSADAVELRRQMQTKNREAMPVRKVTSAISQTVKEWDPDMMEQVTTTKDVEVEVNVKAAEPYRITEMVDLHLVLYRHWTLYEAMFNSTFVATRLGIWKEQGQTKLKQLIASMGLRMQDIQQNYKNMSKSVKDQFDTSLAHYAEQFQLKDIFYQSFSLRKEYEQPIMASEVVYAVNALLEFACGSSILTASHIATSSAEATEMEDINKEWKQNFWEAYDVLRTGCSKLDQGIRLAIRLQERVVAVAQSVIIKQSLIRTDKFHYVILERTPDTEIFVHPLALTKLCHFLLDALYINQSRRNRRNVSALDVEMEAPPNLVVCCSHESRSTFVVVGAKGQGPMNPGFQTNSFGAAFNQAATQTNARVKHDSFNDHVLEIRAEDLKKFLEYLHSGLVSIL